MATSLTGTLDYPILDGYRLTGGGVGDQDCNWMPTTALTRMEPSGSVREASRYQGAGYPLEGGWWEITMRYKHLPGALYDLVTDILEAPGSHTLVLWKRRTKIYAGNGSRTTFYLPWAPAGITWNLPGMIAAAADQLATEVKIGIGGTDSNGVAQTSTAFTVSVKASGPYAGTPGAGEAWFLDDGTEFKVGTAPASGERLYLRYVPIFPVLRRPGVSEKNAAGSILEPRDFVLET